MPAKGDEFMIFDTVPLDTARTKDENGYLQLNDGHFCDHRIGLFNIKM